MCCGEGNKNLTDNMNYIDNIMYGKNENNIMYHKNEIHKYTNVQYKLRSDIGHEYH